MLDRFTEYKIELLRDHDNSRAIYQVMQDMVEQYYWETSDDDLSVEEEPFGVAYKIEAALSLLGDLSMYRRLTQYEDDIPEYLTYLEPFMDEDD